MADVTDMLAALAEVKGCYMHAQLAQKMKWPVARVHRVMNVLRKKGYVEAMRPNCYRATEAGREAQKTAKESADNAKTKKRITRWESEGFTARLWTAMRRLKKFEISDIVQLAARPGDNADARDKQARVYVAALARAGYVLKTRAQGGHRRAKYLLLPEMDTGARAPAVHANGRVRDRNTDQIVLKARAGAA